MPEYKEYHTIDKSSWGSGPWLSEPDKIQFQDEDTFLPCLIKRARDLGHLCGYVGVPSSHPLYEKDYMEIDEDIRVHGGLTYSASCDQECDEANSVCHIPNPDESDDVWWLGFDCAHVGDLSPGMQEYYSNLPLNPALSKYNLDKSYRDLTYVKENTKNLAKQLWNLRQTKIDL